MSQHAHHRRARPLDDIDYAILAILQEDASLDRQTISQKLKDSGHELGSSACFNRISFLRSHGYIKSTCAVLDPSMFGLPQIAFMIVKLNQTDEESVERFMASAKRERGVMALYKMAGLCDFIVKVRSRDVDSALVISSHLAANIAHIDTYFASTDSWETSFIRLGNHV